MTNNARDIILNGIERKSCNCARCGQEFLSESYINTSKIIADLKRAMPTVEELQTIVDLYNDNERCPIDGSKVTWVEYREHFAKAIYNLVMEKLK